MKNLMLFLIFYIPVYAFTFLGYYEEGHDPMEITIMMNGVSITALILVEWMRFVYSVFK